MIKFKKKDKEMPVIPTSSLPDIMFLLLIFFMVSSTFRQSMGLPVKLPQARNIEKLEAKKNVVSLWVSAKDEISIDDKLMDRVTDVRRVMYPKVAENNRIIVSMKADKTVDMGFISDIQQELRLVNALRLNYTASYGD